MKIDRFEDIVAWREARILAKMVYDAISKNEKFARDYQLRNQAIDAAVSTMSNIAEGFSRRSNKEFSQFLFISKSSAAEVESIFYVALDQSYISQKAFDDVYEQAEKVAKLDSGFIKYLSARVKKYKTQ